jgi:ATP-dependent DNA ligase
VSDLEGVVGKRAQSIYQTDRRSTSWLKVKNPNYTQIRARHEVFDARRDHRVVGRRRLTPALRLI